MISIITAVHNQLAVNRVFLEALRRHTRNAWELIIIDNASTDGSAEFFESAGARVIRNDGNYSYSYCQNQGIAVARHDVLAFLNNDIIVSPAWDQRMLAVMEQNGLEVATSCGIERMEDRSRTRRTRKKWGVIKGVVGMFGHSERTFRLMHRLMYGDWEKFTDRRYEQFGARVLEGFVGNTVVIKRSAFDKIGLWDQRIYGADFDLYLRTKERHATKGDIKPVHIALGVFNHHFIRLTLRSRPPAFKDQANLIKLEDKWGKEKTQQYLRAMEQA